MQSIVSYYLFEITVVARTGLNPAHVDCSAGTNKIDHHTVFGFYTLSIASSLILYYLYDIKKKTTVIHSAANWFIKNIIATADNAE